MTVMNQNQNTQDLVGEAARINVYCEDCRAAGKQPDSRAVKRLNHITSMARGRLSPQQMQSAEAHMNHAMIKIREDNNTRQQAEFTAHQAQEQSKRQKYLVNLLRDSTGSMTTPPLEDFGDFAKIRDGEDITVPTKKNRLNKPLLAEQVKKKYGTSLNEHLRRLDHMSELELAGDDDASDDAREKYGFDAETTQNWREGAGLEYTMQERLAKRDEDEPDEETITPTDDDIRKVDIIDSTHKSGQLAVTDLQEFEATNQDLLNEDSRHGAVAAAWLECESYATEQAEKQE